MSERSPSLELCTAEQFADDGLQEIHKIWRSNNTRLRRILRTKEVPYFGLHGTSNANLQSILGSQQCRVQIATFHEKPNDIDSYLSQLYSLSGYVIPYAFTVKLAREDPGGILIFRTGDDQENKALWWENLKGTIASLSFALHSDNAREEKMIESIKHLGKTKQGEYPSRSSLQIKTDGWEEAYQGHFSLEQASVYREALPDGMETIARDILRTRIMVQDILMTSFKALNVVD